MKKKPKKASFSEFHDYDESLLLASRAGNFSAGNELLKRFFDMRYLLGKVLSPTIVKLLDSWEFNHAFFDAYNSTCRFYLHNRGSTVRTYFKTVLKNALIAEASSSQVHQRLRTISLDQFDFSQEGNSYCLNDIVPSGQDLLSDVTYYVNYMETVGKFVEKDFGLSKMDKAIVRLRADGLAFEEVGEVLSIPASRARIGFQKFYKTALDAIKTTSSDKIRRDLDRLL